MSKKVPAPKGRRIARGGPAGRGPTKDAPRGTSATDRPLMPPRRLRRDRPDPRTGSTGPGKGPGSPWEHLAEGDD